MMNRNMILLATLMFLLNFVAGAAPIQTRELPPLVPGTLDWDYIGNSFSDFAVDAENGLGRWMQNFVDEIEVTSDGTAIVLANGFVEVRQRSGWTVQQRFAAPGVHDAAWSADDRLWLATADAVREVDAMG